MLTIVLAIAISVLILFFPLLLWIHNIYDRLTILKVNSFEKFKEKMKWRILPDKKLFDPSTWFKPVTYTIQDLEKEFVKMEKKLNKKIFDIFNKVGISFIIFGAYVLLAKNIGYYYIKLKIGYEVPRKFALGEVFYLMFLSIWVALVLFRKLAIYRINMFIKKLKEFKNVEHLESTETQR